MSPKPVQQSGAPSSSLDNTQGNGSKFGSNRRGRRKRVDMGRAEWSRKAGDRRARNDKNHVNPKRRKTSHSDDENIKIRKPVYAIDFSNEEIKAEDRRPKRKVAVFIGYSGSGYKGMQFNDKEKTIEGDLFRAFVEAGAISKANADDPKKSSLVRCARTDKGVHAAGNLISLKLIIEDKDIIHRINTHLPPQIRVWGIVRTNGSFSAYQLCDSRIYEYLIPTHCFLCPHPTSFLGKRLKELAEEAGDREGYDHRQQEVAQFWPNVEEKWINPILERCEPSVKSLVIRALQTYMHDQSLAESHAAANVTVEAVNTVEQDETFGSSGFKLKDRLPLDNPTQATRNSSQVELAMKELRAAYLNAKKAYRIHPDRLTRIKSSLTYFVGTHNFHNYTIQKSYNDPSAKRVIKSFSVSETPILINDTEWLSLKIHGQSFMMHQIRKMVSMVALLVRCGCHERRLEESFQAERLVIPKAPGSGLLLERPVFDSYNAKLSDQEDKQPIIFTPFANEMETFKQKEIYERIFREEEGDNRFHALFTGCDHLESSQLLYLSSMGIAATTKPRMSEDAATVADLASSDEGNVMEAD